MIGTTREGWSDRGDKTSAEKPKVAEPESVKEAPEAVAQPEPVKTKKEKKSRKKKVEKPREKKVRDRKFLVGGR